MKVLCIDASNRTGVPHAFLREGEIYEVIGEGITLSGCPAYVLPFNRPSYNPDTGKRNPSALYRKVRFILVSEIDERELVNNIKQQRS